MYFICLDCLSLMICIKGEHTTLYKCNNCSKIYKIKIRKTEKKRAISPLTVFYENSTYYIKEE